MDYIGATPQQNPLMGLLAERLKQAQEFATRPFGYQNPPAEMLLNLLGIPAVQQTAERLAYGEPLTTGRGMTTRPRPEAVEAALTVAPVAGLLGKTAERGAMAVGRAGERYAEKVVPQIMERGGLPAQLLQDLGQGSISPMDVWHGSPYRFDRFDASKIGTGEGAQAYGHGLYFGEARGTGEQYRDMLKQKQFAKIVEKGRNNYDVIAPDGSIVAEGVYRGNAQKAYDAYNAEVGNLYKVDLPDEAIAKMLDWDKPLSEKEMISLYESLDKVDPRFAMDFQDSWYRMNDNTGKGLDGQDVYMALMNHLKSPEAVSQTLKESGIPGIRYLDQGSRSPGGSNTSNFVVFPGNENLLTIKEINDKKIRNLLD